jgi:hypothetical protein
MPPYEDSPKRGKLGKPSMTTTTEALPPLPLPDKQGCEDDPMYGIRPVDYFTADQMRAYAAEAVRAALAQPQPSAEPVARVVSWANGSYSRNYKLEWLRDVPEGAALYTTQPAPAQPVAWQPIETVPEGCTPADAAMLRRANHAMADEVHLLRTALADLHRQVQEFVTTDGEADFYTGPALAALSKTSPLEYCWPYSSPTADEVIAKLLTTPPKAGT